MDDPNTLTSFVPLTPEVSSSNFSLGKWFDFARKKSQAGSKTSVLLEASQESDLSYSSNQNAIDSISAREKRQSEFTSSCPTPESSPSTRRKEKGRYRNVKTILRRLSAIAIDRRWHQTSGDFKNDFKQYWMPDEQCKECYECGERFNIYRRKHHCRVCGQIFCSRCCNQEVSGKVLGFTGDIRVCNYCHKIVVAYAGDDPAKNIEALSEDFKAFNESNQAAQLSNSQGSLSLSSSKSSMSAFPREDSLAALCRVNSSGNLPSNVDRDLVRSPTPLQRSLFDAFGVAPSEANTIKLDFLRDLWRQITHPSSELELQSHRYRLKTYHNCFIGHELVDWLITNGHANTRTQGVSIGQHFLDNGWIEAVPAAVEVVFRDEYMLYQPGKSAIQDLDTHATASALTSSGLPTSATADGALQNNLPLDTGLKGIDDDDDSVPIWFRQLSTNTVPSATDADSTSLQQQQQQHPQPPHSTPALARRVSSGRHLDLDHVDLQETDDSRLSELSLQMKLDHFSEPEQLLMRKDLQEQSSKLSLITHVPPPPLDTYVCVEGHPFTSKKKIGKSQSGAQLTDDIPHGVIFPKPSAVEIDEQDCSNYGERLARERLTCAASTHLNALLDQILQKHHLSANWKDIVMSLVMNVSQTVVPDVRRDDDMDIRQYVWFKKVPIGERTECQLVRGVVCSKNIAHKKMIQTFLQPRILMLGCAIEYQRVENKLASLDPLVLQEYEFLKNFVARVLILKPNLVLVEKSVARVAQDMFLAANITLVHNIKDTVMESIARCTGADILQSMEQVTRPRLGTCQTFRLQKYCIPGGECKTLMFFEGCAKDLGCSIVLHGPSRKVLKKVQTALEYLIYVAYHLKLEGRFLLDEFAMPPRLDLLLPKDKMFEALTSFEEPSWDEETKLDPSAETVVESFVEGEVGYKFNKVLGEVILSSSPFCRYPVPYLLMKAGQECSSRMFIPGKIYWSENLDGLEADHAREEAIEDKKGMSSSTLTSNPNVIIRPPHRFTHPNVAMAFYDGSIGNILADYRAQGGQIHLKMYHDFEEMMCKKRKGMDVSMMPLVKNKWSKTVVNKPSTVNPKAPEELKIQLDYMADQKERRQLDCFDAYNHQRIAVLFSSYSSESHNAPKPCISPWAVFMEFYGRNDITLGGFLERYCFRPSYICPSHNCDVPMVNHVRYFAHGSGSLYIHMRNLESRIPGFDQTILTWSWCKQCKQVTPVVPLSLESWSLSFAKYLELRFYGKDYTRRASAEPCGHSIHHDHFQYFSFANMVASFKFCPIELLEIVIPPFTVHIGKEMKGTDLVDDVREFSQRSQVVLASVVDRIQSLKEGEQVGFGSRDAKIKEFLTELTKEKFHFNECIQLLEMKANSVAVSLQETAQHSDDVSTSSNSSAYHEAKDVLNLNPAEVSSLMLDTKNLTIKLKRTLCELVEAWNATLQEYIQQEKKREKSPRPQSPAKGPVHTEIGEYYPTVASDGIFDAKEGEQSYHEPVSEVFLTNGTILRQTFLGAKVPLQHPQPVTGDRVSGAGVPSDPLGASALSKKDFSAESETKQLGKIDDVSQRDKGVDKEVKENSDPRVKVGSPYMVIQSPTGEFEKAASLCSENSKDLDGGEKRLKQPYCNSSDQGSTNAEIGSCAGSVSEQNGDGGSEKPCNNEPSSFTSSSISSGWVGGNKMRCDTVVATTQPLQDPACSQEDQQSDTSSQPGSLMAQGGSDADPTEIPVLPDGNDINDDEMSMLPESECPSDIDSADEAGASVSSDNDGTNDIQLGESAVDFEMRRQASASDAHSSGESDNFESDTSSIDLEDPMERMKVLLEDLKVVAPLRVSPKDESVARRSARLQSAPSPRHSSLIKSRSITPEPTAKPLVLGATPSSPKKQLGHRRLSSAPIMCISKAKDTDGFVDSPVTPGSPFIDVNEGPNFSKDGQQRSGSVDGAFFSYHAVEELRQLAEEVCKEDRKDMERDDPFEIQVTDQDAGDSHSGGNGEHVEQTSTGQTAPLSDVALGSGQTQVPSREKPRRLSLGENSGSGRTSSDVPIADTSKKAMSLGRAQQLSTANRSQRSLDIKDDVDSSRLLATTEGVAAGKRGGSEKMKKIISHLLPSSNFQPIPMPFSPHEHYMSPGATNIAIVINEKEPTSIIAYALSMKDYEVQLQGIVDFMCAKDPVDASISLRLQTQSPVPKRRTNATLPLDGANIESAVIRRKNAVNAQARPRSWTGSGSIPNLTSLRELSELPSEVKPLKGSKTPILDPLHVHRANSLTRTLEGTQSITASIGSSLDNQSMQDDADQETRSIEDSLADRDDSKSYGSGYKDEKKKDELASKNKPLMDYHIKLQFHDRSSKFYCSVYFADQFKQLRELIFPEGEERYLQSLSRCVLWRARGGKSGSSFSKSLDDRFVMKQMSRLELQSFIEFAPYYFQYVTGAITEKRPTVFAKLLGVYRIGFKNTHTNTTMRQDVLVMENLFYKRKVNKIFDLKGSVRSRYVHTSGKEDVLMDENFLEMISESPLFIRPHSKAILSKAIHNDTEFLARYLVMDYSLLVGIDEANSELVVGIIDYIRTFTWDKKLESYVKSTGILGGQGKMPTVVSPAVYRTRFTEAMHRYFLMVPDKWTGFGADLN